MVPQFPKLMGMGVHACLHAQGIALRMVFPALPRAPVAAVAAKKRINLTGVGAAQQHTSDNT